MKTSFTALWYSGCIRHATAVLFVAACMMFMSCREHNNSVAATYYPIDSLLSAQIRILALAHASAEKKAQLDSSVETTIIHPADSVAWVNELGIFKELNVMNKPINQGVYRVTDGLPDNRSNLTLKSITANPAVEKSEGLAVRFMKIYYFRDIQNIKKIEAEFREANALYKSTRYLLLEFEDAQQGPVLSSYAISGGQRMLLGDTVTFAIQGHITRP